jgi:glycine/sarcosine N-methyltransferase
MYDAFSIDYDRFVNWDERLAFELPFLEQQLRPLSSDSNHPICVLDAACGTGQHAIALAQRGFRAAGADLSAGMVERASANAASAGVSVPFVKAGFGEMAGVLKASQLLPFDALLCLGNSLPHVLTPLELGTALADFAFCLRPGGRLILQSRNFDAVLAQRDRWMPPQSHREGDREWLFLRFYDFEPGGLIAFNILTLFREGQSAWQQRITTTHLWPQRQPDLTAALNAAGFHDLLLFGGLNGSPFDPASSGNLVIVATRSS